MFTFNLNHPLRNHYQPIIAENIDKARGSFIERYGEQINFEFTEKQWERRKSKAELLGIPIEIKLNPMYLRRDD